jgi:hypothetical protein
VESRPGHMVCQLQQRTIDDHGKANYACGPAGTAQ